MINAIVLAVPDLKYAIHASLQPFPFSPLTVVCPLTGALRSLLCMHPQFTCSFASCLSLPTFPQALHNKTLHKSHLAYDGIVSAQWLMLMNMHVGVSLPPPIKVVVAAKATPTDVAAASWLAKPAQGADK